MIMQLEAPPLAITVVLASSLAAIGIVAATASRSAPPAIAQFAALIPPPAYFDERWWIGDDDNPVLLKADRAPLAPIMNRTERREAALVGMATPRIDVAQTVGATVSARRHHSFCDRNPTKKRKVWISSTRWTCRK